MARGYLEKEITHALEKNDIVSSTKSQIFYKPEYKGGGYRKGRQWLIKNSPTIALGAAGLGGIAIGITAIYSPTLAAKIGAGIGAIGLVGVVARSIVPVDKFLYSNPKDIARRYFKTIDVPWNQAYERLSVKSKRELDGFVYMAQTPTAIKEEFHHHDAQVTLGVSIARITDLLSNASFNRDSYISRLGLEDVIKMMTLQKIGTPQDTKLIKELGKKYSPKKLASKIRRGRLKSISGIDTLDKYLKDYEFTLRISEADTVESVGSQISKGHLLITNAVGPNAGCYAGMHSKQKDFPRISIGDDAGHSLMTHATRGLTVVGGNAEQGVLERASGGIAIIEGTAEHNFAHDMTDSDWPAIAISIGGITEEVYKGKVKDGFVASLNKSRILNGEPAIYIFNNWEMEKEVLSGDETDKRTVAERAKSYIADWKRKQNHKK